MKKVMCRKGVRALASRVNGLFIQVFVRTVVCEDCVVLAVADGSFSDQASRHAGE